MSVMLQRLWIQLTADRRKFGVLCAALAVGLLLWARIILTSSVPRTAVADKATVVAASPPTQADDGLEMAMARLRSRRKPIELDERPMRDPFVISPVHFPNRTSQGLHPADQGKFTDQEADAFVDAAARRLATLQALAAGLRLEAAMSGAGIGVISGHTARLGDFIPAVGNPDVKFELIEVNHRSVVLRFEEYTFELHMANPGK